MMTDWQHKPRNFYEVGLTFDLLPKKWTNPTKLLTSLRELLSSFIILIIKKSNWNRQLRYLGITLLRYLSLIALVFIASRFLFSKLRKVNSFIVRLLTGIPLLIILEDKDAPGGPGGEIIQAILMKNFLRSINCGELVERSRRKQYSINLIVSASNCSNSEFRNNDSKSRNNFPNNEEKRKF